MKFGGKDWQKIDSKVKQGELGRIQKNLLEQKKKKKQKEKEATNQSQSITTPSDSDDEIPEIEDKKKTTAAHYEPLSNDGKTMSYSYQFDFGTKVNIYTFHE